MGNPCHSARGVVFERRRKNDSRQRHEINVKGSSPCHGNIPSLAANLISCLQVKMRADSLAGKVLEWEAGEGYLFDPIRRRPFVRHLDLGGNPWRVISGVNIGRITTNIGRDLDAPVISMNSLTNKIASSRYLHSQKALMRAIMGALGPLHHYEEWTVILPGIQLI